MATALIAGAAFASALPAGAEVSDDSPPRRPATIEVGSPARLASGGAVIHVDVTLTCYDGGGYGGATIRVTQAVGQSTANGTASSHIDTCTGEPRVITLVVPARGQPFREGTAYATANATSWEGGQVRQGTLEIAAPAA